MNTTHEQLIHNLNYLKLNEMMLHLDDTIHFIHKNSLSFTEGLIKLINYEIDHKEETMTKAMVKVGAFPHLKELKDFDFRFQENINEEQIYDFTTHRFVHQNENIVFLGSSGVGKTHLATSIGISAAKKANIENRLKDRLRHFTKYKLLIIDELGYLPIDKEDSKLLFQLIDRRYEKRSTIITTTLIFHHGEKYSRIRY